MMVDDWDGSTSENSDVCVVGSGPVGLSLATRLAAQGVRVLLFESGEKASNPLIQSLGNAEIDPAAHDDMAIVTSRQLGGTSNLWGARTLPFDPIDFEDRDWIGVRWPITYTEMASYLPDAVRATASGAPVYVESLGSDQVDRAFAAAEAGFRADVLERWANEQRAQVIHREAIRNDPRLVVCTGMTVTGLRFAENGLVEAVEVRGSKDGAPATVPVRQLVLAAGGIETTRLLLAAQRSAPERFGGSDGPLGRYYQGHVVGEIAEIHFARPDFARAFDFRVDSHGSYVRRRIVASAETQRAARLLNCAFWPVVPKIGHADHHSAILSMIYLIMKVGPVARLLVAEKIRQMNLTPDDSSVWAHLLNLLRGAPAAAVFGVEFLAKRFDRKTRLPGIFVRNSGGRYGLSYHSEQLPNPDSRLTLTADTDRLDLPKLKIDLRFLSQDAELTLRQHVLLENWLREAGLAQLRYHLPEPERVASILSQARHGTHQIGTTRMGFSRRDGVVDRNCTTFDCPNLHLATTAVLPTSGQANPTLTAVALALRLADRLARR
ncbi:GMC oxidoreductase (plasmid) [Novosphingobium sp. THN1]|nr:GMC oxidoreductase [Novosphingobium sp. THN1]